MIDNSTLPFIFSVEMVGCVASRMLAAPLEAHVEAVFDSTFYLRSDPFLACIGSDKMEPGPLNIVTSAPPGMNWQASGLQVQASARVSSSEIRIGNQFFFRVELPFVWSPELIAGPLDPKSVKRGLDAFVAGAPEVVPDEGVARLLLPGFQPERQHYVCRAACGPMEEARQWASQEFSSPGLNGQETFGWVEKLSGLGPGLTPSGDDVLGGMMIVLHRVGAVDSCQSLWRAVRRCAEETSNPISYAHLAAASEGTCGAGIHRAISSILCGDVDGVHVSFHDIDRVGQTSGWDTMTGVVAMLQSWLAVRH